MDTKPGGDSLGDDSLGSDAVDDGGAGVRRIEEASGSQCCGLEATVSFHAYRRPFVTPLNTAHGLWRDRQGLILQLQTPDGRRAYGEIAPIPWFGSETLAEASTLLQSLPRWDLGQSPQRVIPDQYPATRFGLGLALAQLRKQLDLAAAVPYEQPETICALLPTGSAALSAWPQLWERGHRTFKWKLGVTDVEAEMDLLVQLRRSLPPAAQLRLDANGGLTLADGKCCLAVCDRLADQGLPIEFLEQPLPPEQFSDLLTLSQSYQTPLALDESVATLPQLQACYERGWRGIFVIKGAIAGEPMALLSVCQTHQLDVVWSAVFGTAIARRGVMAMAAVLDKARASDPAWSQSLVLPSRALGFGVQHWFFTQEGDSPLGQFNGDALWQQLLNG